MLVYIITINNNDVSEKGAMRCVESSVKVGNDFTITAFPATTPDMAEVTLRGCGLEWKYPWEGEKIDLASGLTLKSYPTEYKNRRIACAMSHYRLWYESVEKNVPILILEHDAEFIEKFDPQSILDSKYDIVGINNPLMATRRAKQFFNIVKENKEELQPVPTIDEWNIPQGLAGNSAYIIKPNGAKSVIQAVKDYGMWPNDAIMCRQLIPNMGVTKVFYTKVQGLPSTTTG